MLIYSWLQLEFHVQMHNIMKAGIFITHLMYRRLWMVKECQLKSLWLAEQR